ncbi:MAG: MFS transporter, partial [Chitinophagaceae bacterium]
LATVGYAGILGLLGYSATVQSVWILSIGLFFFGFWGDVLNIAVNTQALQVQEDYYVKPLMSSFHGLWSLGALTAAFAGGMLMQWDISVQAHFTGVALCLSVLAGALHSLLILRDKPREQHQQLLAWPDRSLWLLGGICFCCALCEGAMADWSSLYYKQTLRNIQQISTTGFTAYALLMTAGRFLGDGLVTRLGYRGILFLNSCLIVTGLSTAIFFPSPWVVVLGFGLVGFGVSTIVPIVYTLAGRSSTLAPSVALAAVSTVGFSGFLIGPPLIGFLAHAISLRWALLGVALLGIFIGGLSRIVYAAEQRRH